MAEKIDIKAVRSGDTIVLHYKGETLNIQKQSRPAEFKRVEKLMEALDKEGIVEAFVDIKKMIEGYTKDKLTVDNGVLVDRDGITIPPTIAKKLMELKKAGEDFMPLWRFWQKLKKNPSKNSVQELFGFLEANKIPITELGDFMVEKGVKQKSDGSLWDVHSGKFDNSIGMIVEMPRKDVVDDKHQTCSAGLHVAAPAYVKECYGSNVVIECLVNPADVVSVPVDYHSQKMRVCRYQVVALAKQSPTEKLVVKMEDLIALPKHEERRHNPHNDHADMPHNTFTDLMKLTAKNIISHVRKLTGKRITIDPKNKTAIAKKAEQILHAAGKTDLPMSSEPTRKGEKKVEKKEKEIVFTGLKCQEVIDAVAKVLGKDKAEDMAGSDPRRGRFIAKVTPVLKEQGYVVID